MAVQYDGYTDGLTVSSMARAYPGGVIAGEILFAGVLIYQNTEVHVPVGADFTDTQGNTWSVIRTLRAHTGETIAIATAKAGNTGSNTVTYNHGAINGSILIALGRVTDGDTTTWDDGTGNVGSGTGTASSSGSATPSANGYAIGFMGHESGTTSLTPGSGWTLLGEQEDAAILPFLMMSRTTTNSVGVTAVTDMGASVDWLQTLNLIKQGTAPPSGANQQFMMMGVG